MLVKILLLGAQAMGHATGSSINAEPKTLVNINAINSIMSICQFHAHQMVDCDCTLPDFSGSATKKIEIPNKYFADAKLFLKNLRACYPYIIITGHLNINSLRNQFEILPSLIVDTFDIFMLSETKLDDTFT